MTPFDTRESIDSLKLTNQKNKVNCCQVNVHKISSEYPKTERISYLKESVTSRGGRERDHRVTHVTDPGEEAWQLEDRTGPSPRVCEVSFSELHP